MPFCIGARLAGRFFETLLIRPRKAARVIETDTHGDFAYRPAVMLAFKTATRNTDPYLCEVILDGDAKTGFEAFRQRGRRDAGDPGELAGRTVSARLRVNIVDGAF